MQEEDLLLAQEEDLLPVQEEDKEWSPEKLKMVKKHFFLQLSGDLWAVICYHHWFRGSECLFRDGTWHVKWCKNLFASRDTTSPSANLLAEDAVFLALLECIARSFGFAGSFVGSFACCVRSHVRSGWLVRSWVRSPFVFVRTFVRACSFVVAVSCSLVGAEIRSNRGPN